ncbi:hypothetical protein BS47DRAFT_1396851 [Hydnum rufescens UP504]|uniref:RRM domain-containing protein n=1 Tax=Hydnum rufescens UP504 TaxID=1448309 RepID=A0A9P6DSG5_9AGAM|nr:hypothetical protein BS47DRAFT_1396851 [Hydnum rufescens UP504]
MSTRGRSPSPRAINGSDVEMRNASRSPEARTRTSSAKVVVISNLTRNVLAAHLQAIFSFYGEVRKVDLPVHRRTGQNRGKAALEYKEPSSAQKAMSHMNGGQLDGAFLSVELSDLPLPRSRTPSPRSRSPPCVDSTPTDLSLPEAFAARARHIRDRGRGLLCAEDTDHGTGTGIGIGTLFETRSVEAGVGEAATGVLLHDVDLVLVAGDSAARRARVVPSCGVDMIVAHHEGARPATNEEEGVNYLALSVRILIGAVGHDLPARLENEGHCLAQGRALALAHVAILGAVIRRIRVRLSFALAV